MRDNSKLPPPVAHNGPDNSVMPAADFGVKKSQRKLWFIVIGLIVVLAAVIGGLFMWYSGALQPVDPSDTSERRIIIKQGDGVGQIASNLKQAGVIRNELAFRIYSESSGFGSSLQAGGYVVSPSFSTPDIIKHMSEGETDEFDVTILPGKTIEDIASSLAADGFNVRGIDAAMAASYDHPLLKDKPASASLEGYIYPDTYRVMADGEASDVLVKAFDHFASILEQGKYLQKIEKADLSLHEAITLASIIQLEVPDPEDQRQVAQVFLSRLDIGMQLGSDPTFKYPARLDGKPATIDYDSPYNTRIHTGLPPGPIGNFNLSALDAVVNPAKGDYLYFVSGDDGQTHFARTLDEHEANVNRYCTELCR